MPWIVGADGCKDGWIVVLHNTDSGRFDHRVVSEISDPHTWPERAAVLCIDIPIGLLNVAERGGVGLASN